MLSLSDTASMQGALSLPINATLCSLLSSRMQQFCEHVMFDLSELVRFVVVEPGDTLSVIERELGFSILCNRLDGACFGYPDFTPSWECLIDHTEWFELVFVLSDDGYGVIVFVQDDPGIEFDVHAMCLHYAERPICPIPGTY